MKNRIGFIQDRQSSIIDDCIQCFPWPCWRNELPQAQQFGIRLMEWTLDQDRLSENPLMTVGGRARALGAKHGLAVPSLTGDCFVQASFWKTVETERKAPERDFLAVTKACVAVKIVQMVAPPVDNG